jgi:hypothetical protein
VSARALGEQPAYGSLSALWAYARHELLYLAWALMEVALLAPLALSVMRWTSLWPAPIFALWLLLVMLIPFNLNRLLTLFETPVAQQRKIILGALLAVLVISLRAMLYDGNGLFDTSWLGELFRHFIEPANPLWGRDLTLFLLVLWLWWRGLSLAGRSPDIKEMGLRLRMGALILLPIVASIGAVNRTPVFGFVLLYFFVALIAVSLTRAEELALERTGHSFPLSLRWLGGIALSSLLVVAAAGFVALAVSGDGLELLIRWTQPLWSALRFFATTLVSTVSYLAFNLLRPFIWLLGQIFALLRSLQLLPREAETEVQSELLEWIELLREMTGPEVQVPFWVNRLLLILFIALLLFLTNLGVARFMSSRRLALPGEEQLGAPGDDGSSAGLRQRLRSRLSFWQQWRAAASIRRIYREMADLAASYGYARGAAETPYEYRQALAELWPAGQAESELITEAYVRVRYGELPEDEAELNALRQAWQRLRQMQPPDE